MRCLLVVILESGYFTTYPPVIPLRGKGHSFSSFVEMAPEKWDLPVEGEDIRRVQQTKESDAVDHHFCDHQIHVRSCRVRACEYRAHPERSHPD